MNGTFLSTTNNLVGQLRAVAEGPRWQILAVLAAGPRRSSELSELLGLSRTTTSHHLGVLADAGLVARSLDGRDRRGVVYTLNASGLVELGEALAALATPPVVSFVAKSGTGKTTLMEKLIPELNARGLRVGVVKHHGHATPFDVPGKDTYRLAQAGAAVVVGACAVQVAVFRQENGAADLDQVIARHCAGLDLVLIEGYKRGPYPKVEVHRAARSNELLCGPDDLLALVSDEPWPYDVPQFGLEEVSRLAEFLADWLQRGTPPVADLRSGMETPYA